MENQTFGDRLQSAIGAWTMAIVLLVFVSSLAAPLFAPIIMKWLRRKYVMDRNYEELARRDMVWILPCLWIWAFLSWGFLIFAHMVYPTLG